MYVGYTYDQMVTLEHMDDSIEIHCSKVFHSRGSYVWTRGRGACLRVIRIISYEDDVFWYLCEYTWFGLLCQLFDGFGKKSKFDW